MTRPCCWWSGPRPGTNGCSPTPRHSVAADRAARTAGGYTCAVAPAGGSAPTSQGGKVLEENPPQVSDNPRHHLEETVDALEERVLGERAGQSGDENQDESPAIEQDLDPEDMSSGAGSEPSG